jgi:hypothetical protein
MSDDDAIQRPMYWGPGGPPKKKELVESWTPGRSCAETWGPYHQVLFPPHRVTPWIRFKIMTNGVNIACRFWDEREALRADYESAYGGDPERWPVRHPGVVLESVPWVARAACIGCQWLQYPGTSMREDDWRATAAEFAQQHQDSSE